jgi:hypothetical protein
VLALAEDVEEDESLRIGQHPTNLRMEPIPLRIPTTLIVHCVLLPIRRSRRACVKITALALLRK